MLLRKIKVEVVLSTNGEDGVVLKETSRGVRIPEGALPGNVNLEFRYEWGWGFLGKRIRYVLPSLKWFRRRGTMTRNRNSLERPRFHVYRKPRVLGKKMGKVGPRRTSLPFEPAEEVNCDSSLNTPGCGGGKR